jgi:hypothetical protein
MRRPEAAEAAELVRETLKVARIAVEAELLAVGQSIVESEAPEPAPAWA